MSEKLKIQKHIRCVAGDVAPYVLLPGDPARAERIAEHMDTKTLVAQNREFTIFTGTKSGVDVSVCSTGIGSSSTAIALEELIHVGAHTFIRVGSSGGRQPHIPIGSTLIMTAAYRGEGTSVAYLPMPFPAVASLEVTNALVSAANKIGRKTYTGIGFTRDAFYIQDVELNEKLQRGGVVAAEMEASALFVAGAWHGVQTGCIVASDSNIWLEEQPTLAEKERLYFEGERYVIEIAFGAVELLAGDIND